MRLTVPRRVIRALMGIYRYPLTILRAPPGFGKTAVVNGFLSRRKGTADELPVRVVDDADSLDAMPQGFGAAEHTVLLCRRIPAWLPEEILYGEDTLLLGADTLALTAEEIGEDLYAATGGWPVMLNLPEGKRTEWAREHVLAGLKPVFQGMLASLSLEEMVTAKQAVFVTGNGKAPFLLERLAAGCALLAREDGVYRMNPVLRSAACESLGEPSPELLTRYGLWAERQGDSVSALRYYLKAKSTDKALSLLDGPGGGAVADAAPQLAAHLLEPLSLRERARYPYATLAGAYAKLLHTAPEEGRAELRYIRETLAADGRLVDSVHIRGEIEWIEAFAAQTGGERRAHIREAKRILGAAPSRLFPEKMTARLEGTLPFREAVLQAAKCLRRCSSPRAEALLGACEYSLQNEALSPAEAFVLRSYAKGASVRMLSSEMGVEKKEAAKLVAQVYRSTGVRRKKELAAAERRSAI